MLLWSDVAFFTFDMALLLWLLSMVRLLCFGACYQVDEDLTRTKSNNALRAKTIGNAVRDFQLAPAKDVLLLKLITKVRI